MGKNIADPKGDRREPINQPIKFYGGHNPERSLERRLIGPINKRVGAGIEYERTRAGLSVEQLAQRMKMSVARLKKIEAGEGDLTLSLLERIAEALGRYLNVDMG